MLEDFRLGGRPLQEVSGPPLEVLWLRMGVVPGGHVFMLPPGGHSRVIWGWSSDLSRASWILLGL